MRSVHTQNFPHLLSQLEISLVISTYQAGKLIVVRADGKDLNTHFRVFSKPMGVAADRHKIAIGCTYQIWELRNVPAVSAKLNPPHQHDACYLPRTTHITGDIDIHEMAWVGDELWFANTRFSCLCTLDREFSFVPRWTPPFVTGYDLTDRCHLNGLGLKEGQPKYITALGETDTPGGWRKNKANGGILMDIETNDVLVRGLSMPHSPRWYADRLWVLESGNGSLAWVDLNTRTLQTVAQFPGFTRGIDFCGNLAFIGLSQVRESAVFSGMAITKLPERICGVWVVNWQTGETVAFLQFEEAVQEIFAVSVLPGIRFPEIIDWDETLLGSSYVLPDAALARVSSPDETTLTHALAENCFDQGNSLYEEGQLTAAIAQYRRCLELQPDYPQAQYNLAVALGDSDRLVEAIALLQQVIAAQPSDAAAQNRLGHVYSKLRDTQKAIAAYETAIALQPDFAKARFNLGMLLLQSGEFLRGWEECEWRWQTAQFTPFNCPHPRWDGTPILEKTLLVHTEQGAGDAIQFIRYIPLAAQRCRRLLLVCPDSLRSLFADVEGIDDIISAGEIALSAFDTYSPLMSLPHVFGTTLETIPKQIPYLKASANPAIEIRSARSKVGIVWAGSPTHSNDRDRSIPLLQLLPLLQVPELDFYSLQKGKRVADLSQLPAEISIENLATKLTDYTDTAAAISQLDLVIGIDTSVVHLAGALGKPVWTMLCYNPDWRWLLEREDTPWYPTMRLFRQIQPGDWEGVCDRVRTALLEFLPNNP